MTPPPSVLNVQRLVLTPALTAVALGTAAVVWLLAADPTGRIRTGVLACGVVLAAGTVAAGLAAARSAERRLRQDAAGTAAAIAYGDQLLRTALDDLRAGRTPRPVAPQGHPAGGSGPLPAQLEQLNRTALATVAEAAETATPAVKDAATQQVTVLVTIARRLQSLVHQGIEIIDELEQQVEEPDLLRGLFEVDHIATRIRRYVENVAVMGGETTRRQWRKPVPLTLVVRSAIGEVERYSRVKPVPPTEGRLDGSAVADVVHLLAELIENATAFSPPTTDVLIRTQQVTSGVVIEIEDRGLGQRSDEERLRNALLADPTRVEVGELLADGRVGLYVVAVLARQHRIRVELRRNIFGGVTSLVLLPRELLAADGGQGQEPGEPAHEATVAFEPALRAFASDPAPFEPAPQPVAPGRSPSPSPGLSAPVGGPAPTAPGPAAPRPHPDGRPQLPQRTQPHLAPQLRRPQSAGTDHDSAPPSPYGASYQDDSDDVLTPANPGLMAGYRRGVLAAEGQQPAPDGGTFPGAGGTDA